MPHVPDHATHDPELVAAYAAGDATGPDLASATELVASCTECADLHRDLRAIATALPELPPAVRPRDFRITPEQAASLQPSGWRGVLAAFASPRFKLAAPLGTGLAAAGLAGLLLANPGGLAHPASTGGTSGEAPIAAATSATKDATASDASGAVSAPAAASPPAVAPVPAPAASLAAASAAASSAPGAGQPDGNTDIQAAGPALGTSPDADGGGAAGAQPAVSPGREIAAGAVPAPQGSTDATAVPSAPATAPAGTSPWVLVSAVLLLVGVSLLVLRFAARSIARG